MTNEPGIPDAKAVMRGIAGRPRNGVKFRWFQPLDAVGGMAAVRRDATAVLLTLDTGRLHLRDSFAR